MDVSSGALEQQISSPSPSPSQPKGISAAVATGNANLAAWAESGRIMAAGMQDVLHLTTAAGWTSFASIRGAVREGLSVRSFDGAMQLHARLLRDSIDRTMSHTAAVVTKSLHVSEQAFAPVRDRMTPAMDRAV